MRSFSMEQIIIKKYPNLKYWAKGYEKKKYMSPTSKKLNVDTYVNLTEIKEFLRQGKQITVLEHPSNKDITVDVLRSIAIMNYKEVIKNTKNPLTLRYEAIKENV